VAGLFALLGLILLVGDKLRTESAAVHAARLSAEAGIQIASGDPSAFFVSPYGPHDAQLPYVSLSASDSESASVALDAIENALRRYPKGFVAKLIGGLFIAGEVRVGGVIAGGTVGPAWVVLAAPARLGREGIYATSLLGVHHELSSFVYRRRPATSGRWIEFAPPGAEYKTDPKEIIALASKPDPAPDTGFLSAYATSNDENDFNVYAEKMFTEPATVAMLAGEHELIRKKLRFVMVEYIEVDARMKDVFHALGLE
jgi:hypothetical protein